MNTCKICDFDCDSLKGGCRHSCHKEDKIKMKCIKCQCDIIHRNKQGKNIKTCKNCGFQWVKEDNQK